MPKSKLGVASVLVGCSKHDFHERGDDGEGPRLDLMAACAEAALEAECRVLVLPAGFFVASSTPEQRALERRVLTKLKDRDLLVAFGIDLLSKMEGKSAAGAKGTNAATYQPYGYVVEGGEYRILRAAQTGVHSGAVLEETVAEHMGTRQAKSQLLDGATIGLLLCGEVLSPAWHTGLADIEPLLVLHLGHASVPLGGTSKESWSSHVANLLKALRQGTVWAFSDHIRGMAHYAASGAVSLVRRSPDSPVPLVRNQPIEHEIPATMYIHAAA